MKTIVRKIYLHDMKQFDLNLLIALDALLMDESVTLAAERMELSVPAMSHALLRIRKLMGDPILVRAGRGLVATPRALEIRARVHALAQEAHSLVTGTATSLGQVKRTFIIRTEEALIGTLAASLAATVHRSAPGITLRFTSLGGEGGVGPLREGTVDLNIQGNMKLRGPEVKIQHLAMDHAVGVVRPGHPLTRGKVTAKRFAEQAHISASRRGVRGPIDDAMEKLGLERRIAVVVPTFYAALMAVAGSDMVASVPERHTRTAMKLLGLQIFPLPLALEPVRISQAWHPRFDADPVHRFIRGCVRSECRLLWDTGTPAKHTKKESA